MQRFISWNVASVRARWLNVERLVKTYHPDILALQEIKATADTFPFFETEALGYHAYISGQKGFNGVALLSKEPLTDIKDNLLNESGDELQARFIQGNIGGITVISVYVPNGNPPEKDPTDTTRLQYKLRWFDVLQNHLKSLSGPVVCMGDFNVIEKDTDVYNPAAYRTNALMVLEVRTAFQGLLKLPLEEAIRLKHPEEHYYSFWDFQMRAWEKNYGMLLDRILLTPDLALKVQDAGVLKEVRSWMKTSDHAPVFMTIK